MGRFDAGRIFVLIDRGDYWQCAYVIPKGTIEDVRRAGLEAFRAGLAQSVPMFADRVGELQDWDQIKLLTVAVDRLRDLASAGAAVHRRCRARDVADRRRRHQSRGAGRGRGREHPVGAAAGAGASSEDDLARVQKRREFPARVTQAIQVFLQNRVISRALQARGELKAPLPIRLLARFPLLRRIPARLLGLGVRPEHVQTPEVTQSAA